MSNESAVALHCPNCGAPSKPEAIRCDYCQSRLATVSCPSCFGLLFDAAAFCHHCGAARNRTEKAGDGAHTPCPACKGRMAWVQVGETALLECETCDGTWIEAAAFERLCADREHQAAVLHGAEDVPPPASAAPVRYRPCPKCRTLMNRINFARVSGAVVDVCKGHGTFLDRGELHQIVRFIQKGGMDVARNIERERLVEEQKRLRDADWATRRLSPPAGTGAWNEMALQSLLSALLD